ncbi:MAG: methyltransferase, TIGR04325 family [Pseudoxanthomonas sp.]
MVATMEGILPEGLRPRLTQLVRELAELPGISLLARPLYRRYFRRPYGHGNLYYGLFGSYAAAQQEARALSSPSLPSSYDVAEAARMYRRQLLRVRTCDYAAMFWLDRMFASGTRKVFDLGGHIGLGYYGFGRMMILPADLDWCVHDVPQVMQAGREWALKHDPKRHLRFGDDVLQADGCDLLISSGALQYLEYDLPELLQRLQHPPQHVLFNLVPMHPTKRYFTLQNLGIAVCPYRIEGIVELVAEMARLGYTVRDHWDLPERTLRIPFHPGHAIDRYYGFYFTRTTDANA